MSKQKIVLIVNDIRSAHNVGSLLRTADGLGVNHVYLSGYTPYPETPDDERLPHLRAKAGRQIHKTALGAEKTVDWNHVRNLPELISELKDAGFLIAALEQTADAKDLAGFSTDKNVALMIGSEVGGLAQKYLELADLHLQIPMLGSKESFNVAVAAGMALYHLRYRL